VGCKDISVQAHFAIGIDVWVEPSPTRIRCSRRDGWALPRIVYRKSDAGVSISDTASEPLLNFMWNCVTFSNQPISLVPLRGQDPNPYAGQPTSKKPNSYGVSCGPMISALTFRTSVSRQATARAKTGRHLLVSRVFLKPNQISAGVERLASLNLQRSEFFWMSQSSYMLSALRPRGGGMLSHRGRMRGTRKASYLGDPDNRLVGHGAGSRSARIWGCSVDAVSKSTRVKEYNPLWR
jgi:hypothetical protein